MIYLNNASTSYPTSDVAVEAFLSEVRRVPIDVRSDLDPAADHEAREAIADMVACDPSSVFFCSDATFALNAAIRGVVAPGDRCAIDNRSHNAVIRTLYGIGVTFDTIHLYDDRDDLDDTELARLVTGRYVMACLTHVSNVTGSVFNLEPMIGALRELGTIVVIDASQTAGAARLASVSTADIVVFPSHKHLHGLPGAAALITSRDLPPLIFGGTGHRSASPQTREPGRRFTEVGTGNSPAVRAFGAVVRDYVKGEAEFVATVDARVAQIWDGLGSIEGFTLIGRPPGHARTGVVCCLPSHGDPETEWVPQLRAAGVVIRGGLHCSPGVHEQLGMPNGTLRFSVSRYTTADDVARTLMIVSELNEAFSGAA
jgi:cysteine desulfurase / selenocysteine lyase